MRVCSYLTNRMYSHADNYVVHFCFYEMTEKNTCLQRLLTHRTEFPHRNVVS